MEHFDPSLDSDCNGEDVSLQLQLRHDNYQLRLSFTLYIVDAAPLLQVESLTNDLEIRTRIHSQSLTSGNMGNTNSNMIEISILLIITVFSTALIIQNGAMK